MVKVSFSGCFGGGKTALLSECKKILSLKYSVESIEETTRKNPFDSDKRSSFVSQFFYVSTQINEENIKAISSPDVLLCDTSVFDYWMDWKKHSLDLENSNELEDKNQLLSHLCKFWIKTYELVFFIRVDPVELEKRKEENDLIGPSTEYIRELEQLYLDTIKEDNIQVIEIWNNSSVDESAHKIIEHISGLIQS